jgi:hypothetical protein
MMANIFAGHCTTTMYYRGQRKVRQYVTVDTSKTKSKCGVLEVSTVT